MKTANKTKLLRRGCLLGCGLVAGLFGCAGVRSQSVTSAGPTVSTPATGLKSQRVVSTPLLDGSTSRVLTDLELLHFDALAQFNFAPQSLTSWLQRLGPLLDAQLLPEGTDRTVLVQTLFHKDRPAEFLIVASPPLASAKQQALLEQLQRSLPPRAQLTDYAVRLTAKAGRGAEPAAGGATLAAQLPRPLAARLQEFKSAGTKQRVEQLRVWARTEVLPVLAAVMVTVPEQFSGVRSVGQLVQGLDFGHAVAVGSLLDHNPQYWRGMAEMTQGNPLIPAARVFMHVANGEIDTARLFLKPVYYFSKENNLAHDYIDLLKEMLIVFQSDLEKKIAEGVDFHDQNKYNEAIAVYDSIIAEYPCSALAIYEKFFSRSMLRAQALAGASPTVPGGARPPASKLSEAQAEWQDYRPRVYACNPLFTVDVLARTPKEKYQAMRRYLIRDLFKSEAAAPGDWLRMADIALDLEEYGFSAHVYYMISTMLEGASAGERKMIDHWLYCLEKMGVTSIKQLFQGEHELEFDRISAERRRLMERWPEPAARPGI